MYLERIIPNWIVLPCSSNEEGNGNPLQCSCLENPVDRGAWWAAVRSVTQSQTRLKCLSMHACIGEGNGNPLQHSSLGNPRDQGAWWATVYGVAQSWTWLKRLSSSSSNSSNGKESACNAGDQGLIPGLGSSSGEGNGNPLQYSCLEKPLDREAWWATVHGVTESQTRLSNTHT